MTVDSDTLETIYPIQKNVPKCPSVKSRDTRCSTRCVKNWTKYNQRLPIGHYCECMTRKFLYKN